MSKEKEVYDDWHGRVIVPRDSGRPSANHPLCTTQFREGGSRGEAGQGRDDGRASRWRQETLTSR